MTWVKVHNSMPAHPKFVLAGDRASWLFVCGLCYANEHLTSGFIASHVLPIVAPGVKQLEALAGRLVDAGLWHIADGGWLIHDYGEHQRSASEIRERRAKDAERKAIARGTSNGSPRGQNADSDTDSSRNPDGLRPDPRACAPAPSPEGRRQKAEQKNVNTNAELRSAVIECFAYWQERCGHPQAQLSSDRRGKLETRLRERSKLSDIAGAVADVRLAIDGAAADPFIDEKGKRFDDIELICRTGSKLEDFMGRATRAVTGANVIAIGRNPALERRDRFKLFREDSA